VTQGTDIPVVFAFSTIEGTGLVDSLRSPGSNITGVRYPLPELTAQRFEFLYKLAPGLKRLWIFYDINYPTSKLALESLRPAAAAKGVTLVEVTGTRPEEIPADLEARSASSDIGLEAMLVMPDPNPQSPVGWSAINSFAARHKVPVAGQMASQVEEGALFSYAPDLFELGKLAASLADKIFKGTPAGSIPVITPESYLTLNYKVSQELGLTVSDGMLNRANKIIQ
jgi:putative ABC transport system substrate-binding protein